MFTISYDAEVSDMQAAYKLFRRTCTSTSRPLKWLKVIAILWLIVVGSWTVAHRSVNPGVFGLGAAALYILFGLSWQTNRQIRKTFLNMAAPSTSLPITLACDEQQISFLLQGKSEARFFWTSVLGCAEDDQIFIIIPVKRMFYYIPKRALTEERLNTLRLLASKGPLNC